MFEISDVDVLPTIRLSLKQVQRRTEKRHSLPVLGNTWLRAESIGGLPGIVHADNLVASLLSLSQEDVSNATCTITDKIPCLRHVNDPRPVR